jgi:nucleotide-binding universal stress UspA family protein
MYKNVVVGTDGSPTANRAVEAAAGLARSVGATLHVITAYKPPGSGFAAAAAGAPLVDTGAEYQLRADAAKEVADKAIETFAQGITAESHTVAGDPADVLLDTAESLGADLIVVGSKGMRGARRYLGSVPNSVAHAAHCAVLVVKTD